MSGATRRLVAIALAGLACAIARPAAPAPDLVAFDADEVRRILSHGPWPGPTTTDPSNRLSGEARAIALGRALFFDARLSATGTIACATCHVPERGWTDGRPRAVGLASLDRNTPTVLDVGRQRWFSWDGRADSLWSQSLKPIIDPREMGADPPHVARFLQADPELACRYAEVHGEAPSAGPGADGERLMANVGKALAAFLETVRSPRTAFDVFRDALSRGDHHEAARYPQSAQRGLRLFIGRGNCGFCHVGPAFTNGEFHDVGVPFMVAPGRVDAGRHEGIKRLRADRFNLLGPYSDDATGRSATKTRYVELQHVSYGQFRTPSLRNAALTGPYMHDGRYASLREVVRHYSELDTERIHGHGGEQILRPLRLTPDESDDLVAFLESLTEARAPALPPALAPCRPRVGGG